MVLSATLTTVPSSSTIPDPSVVASTIPRPAGDEYSATASLTGRGYPGPWPVRGETSQPVLRRRTGLADAATERDIGVMSGSGHPFGIDFGGSGIKGAPVDLERGDFAQERVRIDTPKPASPDAVARVFAELL